VLTLFGRAIGKLFERGQVGLLACFSLGMSPVVGTTLKERTAVERNRFFQGGGVAMSHREVEAQYVAICMGEVEAESARRGGEESVRFLSQHPP
jgi:hypothetical protein